MSLSIENENIIFKSDEQIEKEYDCYLDEKTTILIEFKESKQSGWLTFTFPENEKLNNEAIESGNYEDDDLLSEEVCDSFIIYDDGSIALDNWYPYKVYKHICDQIKKELNNG